MCSINFSPTATVVTRTHINVTLYLHYLSCFTAHLGLPDSQVKSRVSKQPFVGIRTSQLAGLKDFPRQRGLSQNSKSSSVCLPLTCLVAALFCSGTRRDLQLNSTVIEIRHPYIQLPKLSDRLLFSWLPRQSVSTHRRHAKLRILIDTADSLGSSSQLYPSFRIYTAFVTIQMSP